MLLSIFRRVMNVQLIDGAFNIMMVHDDDIHVHSEKIKFVFPKLEYVLKAYTTKKKRLLDRGRSKRRTGGAIER